MRECGASGSWTTSVTVCSTLKALNPFCKIHGDKRGFFHFEIIINSLALSDSFEYLCCGSTAIRISCTLTVRGSTLVVRI